MKLLVLTAVAAAAALTGAARPADKAATAAPGADASTTALLAPSSCFRRSDVRNHTVGGPSTLYLGVARNDVFRIEMSNACLRSAVNSDPLIINNFAASQTVCKPLELDITVTAVGPSRCIVSSITRLSPTEVAALPKQMRP